MYKKITKKREIIVITNKSKPNNQTVKRCDLFFKMCVFRSSLSVGYKLLYIKINVTNRDSVQWKNSNYSKKYTFKIQISTKIIKLGNATHSTKVKGEPPPW